MTSLDALVDDSAPTPLAPGRLRLPSILNPAVAMVAVWTGVLLVWVTLPGASFESVTNSRRHESWSSMAYLVVAVGSFATWAVLGASLRPARRRPRVGVTTLRPAHHAALYRSSRALAMIVVVVAGYLLGAGMIAAGGPIALGQLVASGTPWSVLTYTYFKPSQLHGLTIWVALLPALAAASKLGQHATTDRALSHRFRVLYWTGLFIALVLAAVLSDRLIAYEYVIVGWIISAVARANLPRAQLAIGRALRILGIGALVAGVWAASEYGRTFLPQQSAAVAEGSDQVAASDVVGDRFVAYLVSNPNNGLYAVDHASQRTFPYRSANAIFSTLQIEGPVWLDDEAAAEPSRLLEDIYSRDRLTTFSAPGYLFIDAGWGGVILFGGFGALLGAAYRRFRAGELWAVLVYPVLFVGVLDSFRILYWPLTRCLVPVIALFAVSRHVRRTRPAT